MKKENAQQIKALIEQIESLAHEQEGWEPKTAQSS